MRVALRYELLRFSPDSHRFVYDTLFWACLFFDKKQAKKLRVLEIPDRSG